MLARIRRVQSGAGQRTRDNIPRLLLQLEVGRNIGKTIWSVI